MIIYSKLYFDQIFSPTNGWFWPYWCCSLFIPNTSFNNSKFLSAYAISLYVKFSLPNNGNNIVHSSGKLFIQFKLNNGKNPILGLSAVGVYFFVRSHVVCAGISNYTTILANKVILAVHAIIKKFFFNPKGTNWQ